MGNTVYPILAAAFSIFCYPLVAVTGLIALVTGKKRLILASGILFVLIASSWIYAILSIKSELSNGSSDGLSGLLMKGISSSVDIGFGAFMALIAGLIIIAGYVLKKQN